MVIIKQKKSKKKQKKAKNVRLLQQTHEEQEKLDRWAEDSKKAIHQKWKRLEKQT